MIFLDYRFGNHSGLSKLINPSNSFSKCHPVHIIILIAGPTHREDGSNNCIITRRNGLI